MRKKMFGNVWATNGLFGMFWGDVNGQNVWEMFCLMDAVKKNNKPLPMSCASLHTVERFCDVALVGRSVGS
jgi:hypothetical protein